MLLKFFLILYLVLCVWYVLKYIDKCLLLWILLIICVNFLNEWLIFVFLFVIVLSVICILLLFVKILFNFLIILLILVLILVLICVFGCNIIFLVFIVCVFLIFCCKKFILRLNVFGLVVFVILMMYGVWIIILDKLYFFIILWFLVIFKFLIFLWCVFWGVLV